MRWSEAAITSDDVGTAPTIKNHSVTYHRGLLYCFGGYDGRRNHQTLLIYSLKEQRWLTPGGGRHGAEFTVGGSAPPGRNGHTATLATCRSSRQRRRLIEASIRDNMMAQPHNPNIERVPEFMERDLMRRGGNMNIGNNMIVDDSRNNNEGGNAQGGDDHRPNPNDIDAEMAEEVNIMDSNEDDDDEDAQIIIIGGWLGSGPLAAHDMWVLDISGGLERLRWFQPPSRGTNPGPCNMHSSDFIPSRGEVYVFRGGNGREYLNDLHALDVESYVWRQVETNGEAPQQRANHSSAVLEWNGTSELFVFGGWNGSERLNDIHVLDTSTSTWSTPRVTGVKPHPRAGMTLTALRGRLYLFGGSGTSSKCFDDLQILDRAEMCWLDVNDEDAKSTAARCDNAIDNRDIHQWGSAYSGQDGMGGDDDQQGGECRGGNSRSIKFADWRSQENHQVGSALACTSANPNDEDMVPSVFVTGKPPGKRAGHTSTAVGKHIYVFGGSCGTDYLNDFFVLDTDPPPLMKVTEPASPQLYARRLQHFYNDEEFSDVTFMVEGRRVYGHKLVLSTVSDCFRAMFMTGFRESGAGCTEIEIPHTTYDIFVAMMEYIYTGKAPEIDVFSTEPGHGLDRAIALLELADQFFLYNLKQSCEQLLQPAVNAETYTFLLNVAQKTNASQLESYCRYFERNMNELMD
eukprot:g4989.t1 g4989   contig18:399533-401689(-)